MTRALAAAAAITAAALVAIGVLVAPASADPVADAQTQAARLQAQVASLTVQAEQASEKFDAAQAALGQLVVEQREAQQQSAAAQTAADSDKAALELRVRALYMSGGTLGLYASIFGGHDPTQVLSGLHDVAALSNADAHAVTAVGNSTDAATRAGDQVNALLAEQAKLTATAQAAAAQVQTTLAQEQTALDDANSQVRTLEAQLQASLDAQAAAQAAQTLAAAAQAALAAGYIAGPLSPLAAAVIAHAQTQLGKPYVFGGSGPDEWDCSGLTQWAFAQAGVQLPRTAADQWAAVPTKVPLGELQAGDLLFWATNPADPTTIHHVAIYLGSGLMLAAPHTGTTVQIEPVYLDGYFGAVRVG